MPALTLISGKAPGFGAYSAVFTDSTYAEAPLIIAPQSLTDSNANSITMIKTANTSSNLKTQFS